MRPTAHPTGTESRSTRPRINSVSAVQGQLEDQLTDVAKRRAQRRAERAAEHDPKDGARFGRAIDAGWPKRETYAEEIGISPSVLCDLIAGKQPIKVRDLAPILANPAAARVWIADECIAAGLPVPGRKLAFTRRDIEADALLFMEGTGTIRDSFAAWAAERRGASVEDVLAVWRGETAAAEDVG